MNLCNESHMVLVVVLNMYIGVYQNNFNIFSIVYACADDIMCVKSAEIF